MLQALSLLSAGSGALLPPFGASGAATTGIVIAHPTSRRTHADLVRAGGDGEDLPVLVADLPLRS